MDDWFEVVADGAIVFCGPLEACENYAHSQASVLIIRPISF